ncbi:hypothetical protein BH10BAC1_BH10BAC1_20060 [soil metagenome]
MIKYFNNDPFLASMPGNGNKGNNSNLKIVYGAGAILLLLVAAGLVYQHYNDKKIIAQLKKEKEESFNNRM